jgi:condensin complex subunit 3
LLLAALKNSCHATKDATIKLICCKWIKVTRFNPIELLKLLGVIEHEEECEKVVQVLLDVSSSPSDCPELAELSDPEIRAFRASMEKSLVELVEPNQVCETESLFLSRIACSYVPKAPSASRKQCDDCVGKVVPDIPILCEIFQGHAVRLIEAITTGDPDTEDVECFVCLQLLSLAKTAGLQEEGSRRHFAAVMKRLLASGDTPDDLVEGCVQALFASHDQEEGCLEVILEIISDISTARKDDRLSSGGEEDEESANGDVDEQRRVLRILSILSIVLETVSPAVASNPLVEDFAQHIVPAVTHANSLVREAGVSCFGKLGLFTNSGTISAEFKPILLKVASNEREKVEIRGQAVLALSDWAMLFPDVLEPCAIHKTDDDVESEEVVSFGDLIQRLLGHSLPAVAAIGAEVAAKLLFTGRLSDSTLLAHLLLLFFDVNNENADVMADTGNNDEIKEVGSPVRLQQLLSLFFPAYCLKSELGRDAMVGSIGCLLELANRKPPKKSKGKGKTKKAAPVPIVKILEYVCSVAEAGRAAASNAAAECSKKTRGAAPLLTPREGDTPSTEEEERPPAPASPTLLTCIQVAMYLGIEASNLTTTIVRALCKFLASHGGNDIDIDVEPYEDLVRLKEHMEELGMAIIDGTSLKSLATVNELLADVQSDDEGAGDETESENEALDEDEAGDTEDEGPIPSPSKQQRHRTPSSVLDPTTTLMESLTALSVQDKENVPSLTQRKTGKTPATTTTGRRSSRASTRTSNASTVSILESLG